MRSDGMGIGDWLSALAFLFGGGALVSVLRAWLAQRDWRRGIDVALTAASEAAIRSEAKADATAARIEMALEKYIAVEDDRHLALDSENQKIRRELAMTGRNVVRIATSLDIRGIENPE